MSPLPHWLRSAVLASLCLIALYTGVRQCVHRAAAPTPLLGTDYFERFEPVREELPGSGTLGYVLPVAALQAVNDPAHPSFDGMDRDLLARALMMHYILTQQAVAPRHLVISDQEDTLIGNFLREDLVPEWPDSATHRVVASGTHGVRLLVRRER